MPPQNMFPAALLNQQHMMRPENFRQPQMANPQAMM